MLFSIAGSQIELSTLRCTSVCGWRSALMRCSGYRQRRRLSKAGGSALLMRCLCPTPFMCNSLHLQFPSFAIPFVCTVWHINFPTAAVSASTTQCIKATYCQGKHAIGPKTPLLSCRGKEDILILATVTSRACKGDRQY